MGAGRALSCHDVVGFPRQQESVTIAILAGVIVAAIGILADLVITQIQKDHAAGP